MPMTLAAKLLAPVAVAASISAGVVIGQHAPAIAFATPRAALDEFVAAVRAHDTNAVEAMLGPAGYDLLHSGDKVADKHARQRFLTAYDRYAHLVRTSPSVAMLQIGPDNWTFPIPIVKRPRGWVFDTKSGRGELLARRIGRNELDAIQECKAYVDAQRDYASVDRGDGILQYAQRFLSTKGYHDGLYWPAEHGAAQSPLGPAFAKAQANGYIFEASTGPKPFNGYYFRILTAQGDSARGGAYSYVVHGKMIGGFALIAYPAKYGASGIATFMVNQDGLVFQKDLGSDTEALAARIQSFDPGSGWSRA